MTTVYNAELTYVFVDKKALLEVLEYASVQAVREKPTNTFLLRAIETLLRNCETSSS